MRDRPHSRWLRAVHGHRPRAIYGRFRWVGSAFSITSLVSLQTATPAPGVGPDELVDFWPPLVRAGWFLAGFVLVVLLGWYLLAPTIDRVVRRRNRNNPTLYEAVSRYVRVLVLLVAVFVGAGAAGYGQVLSNSALIIAAVTLAVGVAGQEVIGSLVSGLALVADQEFNVGNYIEWADGEGTVQSITLRVTRVLTQNGELVTIPNTVLTNQAITRPFGRGRYRVVEHVGLAYEDDVDEAMHHLVEAALAVEGTLREPTPAVFVDELGEDAVVLRVHYWIEDPRRKDVFEIRSAYALSIKDRLEAAGVDLSRPSQHDLQGRIEIDEIA